MSVNNQTYTLSTLADFWALGDADRIDRAFKEIALGMSQAMRMRDLLRATGAATEQPLPEHFFKWPDSVEWTDDGGKEVGFDLVSEGETLMSMRHTLGEDFHAKDAP